MNDFKQTSHETPIFNMGIAYLMRVDFIQRKMNDYAIIPDYEGWFRTIKTLYRELYPLMTSEERNAFEVQAQKCVTNNVKYSKTIQVYQEQELEKLDVCLRKVIERQKWINPKSEDPRSAVLQS